MSEQFMERATDTTPQVFVGQVEIERGQVVDIAATPLPPGGDASQAVRLLIEMAPYSNPALSTTHWVATRVLRDVDVRSAAETPEGRLREADPKAEVVLFGRLPLGTVRSVLGTSATQRLFRM